jgi:hypothetical protein
MNPNPLSTNSTPMNFRDAAIVATVIMFVFLSATFFPSHSYDSLCADPARYAYELLTSMLAYWIGTFASVTGLMAYAQKKNSGDGTFSEDAVKKAIKEDVEAKAKFVGMRFTV